MPHDGQGPSSAQAPSLAALVGSRICHDLISPVGAIGNGLELLSLKGATDGPESQMMADSVANAQARIRLFRIAFGAADGSQSHAGRELGALLDAVHSESRLNVRWEVTGEVRQDEAKFLFLGVQCLETALTYGGTLAIARPGPVWALRAEAPKLRELKDHWAIALGDPSGAAMVTPDKVQFPLLAQQAAVIGRIPQVRFQDGLAELTL